MELNVERGKGYVPADRNKREGQPIGVIPIDAIFSPVEKANFTVEKTRVGQSTDYDRLLIEVWTDGTMSPEEAVSHAAVAVHPAPGRCSSASATRSRSTRRRIAARRAARTA